MGKVIVMETLGVNREAIEKKYKCISEALGERQVPAHVMVKQAANGMDILGITYQDSLWLLNSRRNPKYAAITYADRYQIRLYGIYFIFGLSDGRCIRELLKKCDDTNRIVICEPDLDIFHVAAIRFDLSDILDDERVILYIPGVTEDIKDTLKEVIEYSRVGIIDFCILPGYDILYKDVCENYMESILDKIQDIMVHRGTYMQFNRMIPQHTFYHMKKMIEQRNLRQLGCALESYDLQNVPAIIVSAGPSLDKNIEELKAAQGKAFIVVVDAAVRTVVRAGIRPDMICTIDPESPDRFFEGLDLSDMNWVCMRLTRPEILKWGDERIFYYGFFERSWNALLEQKLGYIFPDVLSGGSVTSIAFMMAYCLGFKKLILIGQDMAFTGGVSHTKGINEAFGDNDEYIKSRALMQVEGIDGEVLETDFQMWYYLKWFENTIKVLKDRISVMDATEGGARIEGTEIISLKEVIVRECVSELDVYEIASKIPPMFTEEQKKELLEALEKMPEQLADFEKKVELCITKQEALLGQLKAGRFDTNKVKRSLSEILEDNAKLEEATLFDMIVLYSKKEEYEVGSDIYAKQDMKVEELLERNLLLCRGYRNAVAMFKEDFERYAIRQNRTESE